MFLMKLKIATAALLMAGVLGSSMFLVAGMAPATEQGKEKPQEKEPSKWVGEWLFEGNADQPCAIFQHGKVLLMVNEEGDFETGRITEHTKIVTLKGAWEEGLVGELTDEGKTIRWGNGTTWKRP